MFTQIHSLGENLDKRELLDKIKAHLYSTHAAILFLKEVSGFKSLTDSLISEFAGIDGILGVRNSESGPGGWWENMAGKH